jgi:excisionase family DNA binding protein
MFITVLCLFSDVFSGCADFASEPTPKGVTLMAVATVEAKPGRSREFVPIREVATLLDVSPRTVLNMVRDGRLQSIQLGKVIRVPTVELERLRREAGLTV